MTQTEFDIEELLEAPFKKEEEEIFAKKSSNSPVGNSESRTIKDAEPAPSEVNSTSSKHHHHHHRRSSKDDGDKYSKHRDEKSVDRQSASRERYFDRFDRRDDRYDRRDDRYDRRDDKRYDRRDDRYDDRRYDRYDRYDRSEKYDDRDRDRRSRHDDRKYERKSSRYGSKSPEGDRRNGSSSKRPASASTAVNPENIGPVNPAERDRRTVFCQQLSARLQSRELHDFLSVCGKIREAKIVQDKFSRRSKGVAYVEFYSEDSVPKAISMTGQKLLGIPIIVGASEAYKNLEAEKKLAEAKAAEKEKIAASQPEIITTKLLVGNLSSGVTEKDLETLFSECGRLESVKVPTDAHSGRSKGYAFVTFRTTYDARYAISKFHNQELQGKAIQVRALDEKEEKVRFDKDLDDSDVKGVSLNSLSRVELMAKLSREDRTPAAVKSLATSTSPAESNCLILKNMFDLKEDLAPNWQREIEEDVFDECSKFGKVEHIAVDPKSNGYIYLKFDSAESSKKAFDALNGRYFAGKEIAAEFISLPTYQSKYPS